MIERLRAAWRAFLHPPDNLVKRAKDKARDPEGSEEIVRQGKQAERILNDPVFARAVRDADERFIMAWKEAEGDPDRRENMWQRQAALGQVLQQLTVIVNNAHVEQNK